MSMVDFAFGPAILVLLATTMTVSLWIFVCKTRLSYKGRLSISYKNFQMSSKPVCELTRKSAMSALEYPRAELRHLVVGCISGKDKSTQKDPTSGISTLSDDLDSDSDSDSDGFWEELKSEDTQHSQLEECWKDVHHAITSL